jgi:hypothetical protein
MKQQFDDLSKSADNLNPTAMIGDLNKSVEDALKIDPASPSAPVTPPAEETVAQPDPNAPSSEIAAPEPLASEPQPSVAADAPEKPA